MNNSGGFVIPYPLVFLCVMQIIKIKEDTNNTINQVGILAWL